MTDFETHPDRYVHWKLAIDGPIARLVMEVKEDRPFREGYKLKLNSYDLGVDLELSDAVQRLRFEHPEVRVVVLTSGNPRVFCAGANIMMLGQSSHPFKVNFCKFTNETRCAIEDSSAHSGLRWIAALNGTGSGGGYELPLACDEIYLVDDNSSAVSLPEVPLLGVLPGTGGLTRLVDKRRVRRDLADVFSTLAEGVKAKKAQEWRLIDGYFPRSRFEDAVLERARQLAAAAPPRAGARAGIRLEPLAPRVQPDRIEYRHVTLTIDRERRTAELNVRGPGPDEPVTPAAIHAAGSNAWALRAWRELDDALCRLRLDEEEIGLVLLKTAGDGDAVLRVDEALAQHQGDPLVREILLHMARTLRRLDLTAKSLFALLEAGSCFSGCLFELALAADRSYLLRDAEPPVTVALGPLSDGALPMSHGLTRLQSRFQGEPGKAERLARERRRLDAGEALEAGLVTAAPDALDWDDEVRVAIEERASLSPDALTGMEASLRFGGPETMDSKIYGRLSAWQNWIFTRPNSTGERGALKLYGQPERPKFDWRRT
jgi:benzoyl-CoA-dihydrodiol lyase